MSAPVPSPDFAAAFPNSRKVSIEGGSPGMPLAVPMREIALSGGEPPLRVYDTSGPQGHDVRTGLPPLRAEWIRARGEVIETDRSYRPVPDAPHAGVPETLRRPAL